MKIGEHEKNTPAVETQGLDREIKKCLSMSFPKGMFVAMALVWKSKPWYDFQKLGLYVALAALLASFINDLLGR